MRMWRWQQRAPPLLAMNTKLSLTMHSLCGLCARMHVQVKARYADAGNGIVDFYVGVNFVPSPADGLWSCR